MTTKKQLVGIDEVGRGCIAGPVSVGAVVMYSGVRLPDFSNVKCSKKLTSKKRREWLQLAQQKREEGKLDFTVIHVEPSVVDKDGISSAIQQALAKSLDSLSLEGKRSLIMLDGGLKAPEKFPYQQTVIKGDEKDQVISLASVVAKVIRDELMEEYSKKYPQYGFERHKGYGTKLHKERVSLYGSCRLHRKSFLH